MNAEWWVEMADLDADQESVMALPLERDCLIFGPPGSGKTNLLLLRANYVAQAVSPNVLVVVFGRGLREFLVRGGRQYNFDPSRIKTSTACFFDLLKQYGHASPPDGLPFERVRVELVERVRALIASLGTAPYDAIFIDEAQDFLPEEIELLSALGKRLFAVADPKQKIYSAKLGLEILEKRCELRVLRRHYRNGEKICRFADAIGETMASYTPMLPTFRYDEAKNPSSIVYESLPFGEQVDRISHNLSIQAKAFPNELLAVVCPRRVDVDMMYDALRHRDVGVPINKQVYDNGFSDFGDEGQVEVMTIHGSKGLEFRAVHGAMLESIRRFPLQRNLIFTLATRAKTSLSLYGDQLPPFIESALMATAPPRQVPPLSAAFGRLP